MKDSYLTVASSAEGVYKEKGSKFLATIFEIASEEEALSHVADFKKRATMHATTVMRTNWVLMGINIERMTMESPLNRREEFIRGQIRSRGITNVLIIVVRYFGGTKLGVSGLINAYKLSALDAIENASIRKVVEKLDCF